MFGLGFTEILLLGLIAFLVLGPNNFPKALKSFLSLLNEIRRNSMEIKREIHFVQTTAKKEFQKITGSAERYLDLMESREEPAKKEPASDSSTESPPDLKKSVDSNKEPSPDLKSPAPSDSKKPGSFSDRKNKKEN